MEAPARTSQSGRDVAERLLLDRREVARLTRLARMDFGIAHEDAEDVLQETAIAVSNERTQILNPRGYVNRVFYLRCCQFARAAKRRRGRDQQASAIRARAGGGLEPAMLLALSQALDRISPKCQELVAQHYIQGKGLSEAAQDLGYSPKQAWKRFNLCLQKLRECLERRVPR